MKQNDYLYLAAGGVVLYFLLKSKSAAAAPHYPVSTVPGSVAITQPSQSLVLPILSSISTIAQNLISQNKAGTNVSQGYNSDGTISVIDTGQQSVNQLSNDSGPSLATTVIPVVSTQSSSPVDSDDDSNMSDYLIM